MKVLCLFLMAVMFLVVNTNGQNVNSSNGGYESRRIVNKKKFHVLYSEVSIDKTVDEVWNEVAGNFMNIGEVMRDVNFTRCLSGDTVNGLGAVRLCNLDFQGKTLEIKELIIDFKECGDHREFTYDVYEAPGNPVKTYGTWVVRKGADGKTYLGSVFVFRANFAPITGLVEKKLKKAGIRTGVLGYKHYLETGARNVDPKKLNELYPL